jgi:pimeloyl-ACP methyl ester carboxylesterase
MLGVLEYEDLTETVLVGHSYGGAVVTGVADRALDRLAHLVYLDAFIPRDGQSLRDLWDDATWQRFRQRADAAGEGWLVPPSQPPFGSLPGRDRRTPHPLKSFADPVSAARLWSAPLPRSVILCTQRTPGGPFAAINDAAAQARAAGHGYYEVPTDHNAQVAAPEDLAAILIGLA